MGDRSRDPVRQTPHNPESAASWSGRCAAEARAYILWVCGPNVASRVVEDALDRVARVAGDGASPRPAEAAARVREVVRESALAEACRVRSRPAARLGRVGRAKAGCAEVPGLLGERAAGRLSTAELLALYQRIDRCADCARLTCRVDAAEWHLERALAGPPPGPGPRRAPAGSNGRGRTQTVRSTNVRLIPGRPIPAAGNGRPPTSPDLPPLAARSAASGRRRSVRPRALALAAGLVLLLAAAAVYAVIALRGAGPDRSAVIAPISRHRLAQIPVTRSGPPAAPLPGLSGGQLTLGSPPSEELLLSAATPPTPAAMAAAIVIGDPSGGLVLAR